MLVLTVSAFGCHQPFPVNTLHGEKVWVLGHGGDGFETFRNPFPANTFPAAKHAVEVEGAHGVELDVRLTEDGVPVVFHDQILDTKTRCTGCVETSESSYIESCEVDVRPMAGLSNTYHVVSLDSVLSYFSQFSPPPLIYVNAKPEPGCSEVAIEAHSRRFAGILDSLISSYHAESWMLVEAGYFPFLRDLHEMNPQLPVYYGTNYFAQGRDSIVKYGLKGLVIDNNSINSDQVAELHSLGIWVGIYGVKIKSGAKTAIAKSPEFILADDIRMVRQLLGN